MPKANTYRVERMLGPYGFSVTDVQVIEGNRKRPAVFQKIGDFIDLNKVDVRTLVRSAMVGQIRNLVVGGALSTMPQEVSEVREQEIQAAIAEFGVPSYVDHPMATSVKYVQLEPGVTIAVNQAVEPEKKIEIIQPPAPPQTAEIEPGMVAPTGAAGGTTPETLAEPVASTRSKKGKKLVKKEPEGDLAIDQPKSQYADWKLNIDFQAQKRKIVESIDADFLKWVVANEESIQFQKLAQTRLAESGL